MAPWPLAVSALILAAAEAAPILTFVGSGGCDADDKACVEAGGDDEHMLRALSVDEKGAMTPVGTMAVNTGGMPVWIATLETPVSKCVFVTLGDKDEVLAYKMTGTSLAEVSRVPSGGRTPVFAEPTGDNRVLLVANYNAPDDTNTSNGASVASFRIAMDCGLTFADRKNHTGASVDPRRQGGAHAHSFVPAPNGLAYGCDLGMDTIFTYQVGPEGELTELSRTETGLGVGPRHLAPHPTLPFVYVVNEMGQTVTAYSQEAHGQLVYLQTVDLVPPNANRTGSKAAEILLSSDGRRLYASNRGVQNTVTLFNVREEDGKLEQLLQVDMPSYPRGMALALDGSILLVEGQSRTTLASFRVGADGRFEPSGYSIADGLPPHPAAIATLSGPSTGVVV